MTLKEAHMSVTGYSRDVKAHCSLKGPLKSQGFLYTASIYLTSFIQNTHVEELLLKRIVDKKQMLGHNQIENHPREKTWCLFLFCFL